MLRWHVISSYKVERSGCPPLMGLESCQKSSITLLGAGWFESLDRDWLLDCHAVGGDITSEMEGSPSISRAEQIVERGSKYV